MEKSLYESIEKDINFQRKQWAIQRIGWVILCIFLFFGLLGFFGPGPLSKKVIKEKNYSIEYNQYLRHSMNTQLIIYVEDLGPNNSLSINSDYFKKIRVENILPEPESAILINDMLTFKFSERKNEEIIFYLIPDKRGSHELGLIINGKKKTFHQYVYF